MTVNVNFLKIPLNKLYYIDNLDDFKGLEKDDLESLKNEYDEAEIKEIVASVKWATQNPNYDFSSLLPNIRYGNADIFKYFCKLEGSLNNL